MGYSDLYVLSKQDLWDSLVEYPDAKKTLIEKGRQMLRKDNLLDEEIARRQDMEHNSLEHKVDSLETVYENMRTRIARLLTEFDGMQLELAERLVHVEKKMQRRRNVSQTIKKKENSEEKIIEKRQEFNERK